MSRHVEPPWPVLLLTMNLGGGGTERQLTEIARSLDRGRFTPHVGCFHSEGYRADELRAYGVPVVEFPVRSLRKPSALVGAHKLGQYLRQRRIQLVHTFDYPMNCFGVPAARAYRAPVVLSSQRAYRSLNTRLYRQWLRATDRMVDGVVVNCEAMRRHLMEDEGVPDRLIRLCYNGIDTSLFRPQMRARVPELADASLVIGSVSMLRTEKGLSTLLRAFAEVRAQRPGLRLVLVGEGAERTALERLSRELGITDQCWIAGETSTVARWLGSIDVFVLPSLSEALSNSLMEAMASGCAVVASRVGGNPELVSHGETGLLFDAGNVADLAAQLRTMITNDAARQSMADAAARRIANEFSLEVSSRRMGEIYTEFLGTSG